MCRRTIIWTRPKTLKVYRKKCGKLQFSSVVEFSPNLDYVLYKSIAIFCICYMVSESTAYFFSPKTASEACWMKDLSPDLELSPTVLSTVSVTLSLANSVVDFWESGFTAEETLSEISLRPVSDIINCFGWRIKRMDP